jgi:hypothetical protein
MTRMRYNVGVRFSPIGDSSTTDETSVATKHWALVFSPQPDNTSSRLIELVKGNDDIIVMITTEYDFLLPAHPVATYEGELSDTDRILEAHPMRGSCYSTFFNNCQHFVATFLHFLDAFAFGHDDRSFTVTDSGRIERVHSVLSRDGRQFYNAPNMQLEAARLKAMVGGVATFAAASIAAEATVVSTVVSTVPAAGFMGWFGATTTATSTVVAPAAYAAISATAAPVVFGSTIVAGLGYKWKESTWRAKTLFDNPYFSGFPPGVRRPLSLEERTPPENKEVWGVGSVIPYKSVESGVSRVQALLERISTRSYPTESLMTPPS